MKSIFLYQRNQLRFIFNQFSKTLCYLPALILITIPFNAYADINKYKNDPIDRIDRENPHMQTEIESKFIDAFYQHTRPYHFDNDISAKIRNLLSISTGGAQKINFIGIGFREKSIEWDGLAVETTYKKVMGSYSQKLKINGSDIPSIFSSSLSSE